MKPQKDKSSDRLLPPPSVRFLHKIHRYMISMTDYAGKEGSAFTNDYYSYLSDDQGLNFSYSQELFKENFLVPKTK